ncbi:uncharacterized protein LOC119985882 isoform X2 [Tripterygium wilfordii]|nr:uncharacterized protein LOC119985882 isoform X2 [Tripterygium wilfordii]
MEIPAFREDFDARDGLSVFPQFPNIGAGCASSGAPDQDPSVTSPEEFRDSRISDNYNEVSLSLARLQRSKSRQRALELRNSVRATKSNSCYERDVGSFACQLDELELTKSADVDFGSYALEEANTGQYNEDSIGGHDSQNALQYDYLDESKPPNPVDGENEHCVVTAVEEAQVGQTDEHNVGAPSCKILLENNRDALELEKPINTGDESCRADEAKAGPRDENVFDACAIGITPRFDNVEEPECVKPVDCCIDFCTTEEIKVGDHDKNNITACSGQRMIELEHVGIFEGTKPVDVSREKRKESGGYIYSARDTRLRSSGQNPSNAKEPIDAAKSSGTIKEYGSELLEYNGKSAQQPDLARDLADLVNPSDGDKEDDFLKSLRKPCQVDEMLQLARPFDVVDGTCGSVTRSSRRVGLDALSSGPPSEAMSMKLKQLDFDDGEEYSLNDTSWLAMKKKKLSMLPDKICIHCCILLIYQKK